MKFINKLTIPVACWIAVFAAGCAPQDAIETETAATPETTVAASVAANTTEVFSEDAEATQASLEKDFYVTAITDEIFERMYGKSYSDDCTVSRDELRYLHVLHKDLNGKTHEGELVCNKAIAHDLIDIFEQLYEVSYPIEKMVLVDEYDAVDEKSMRDNNSSSFNFRFISGTDVISAHGEGLAVDINPLYNPFVTYNYESGEWYIEPDNAWDYVDRDEDFPYKIEDDDICVRLFKEHGFEWGGDWEEEKDYQHFEKEV